MDVNANQQKFDSQVQQAEQQLVNQQQLIQQAITTVTEIFTTLYLVDQNQHTDYLLAQLAIIKNSSIENNTQNTATSFTSTTATEHSNHITLAATSKNSPRLQQLCAQPDVSFVEVETELLLLEATQELDKELNQLNSNQRPLHYVIAHGRYDLIALLLQYDAYVSTDSYDYLASCSATAVIKASIHATLDIYYYLQQQMDIEGFALGRTLKLLTKIDHALITYSDIEVAVVFAGKSGGGKSTTINFLLGVDYEPARSASETKYLRVKQGQELMKAGHTPNSQTEIPQIAYLTEPNLALIDIPGLAADTRGLAWKISATLSNTLLAKHIKTLRSLVFIVNEKDLYDAKADGMREPLHIIAHLIEQNPQLMSHILLVINKCDRDITSAMVHNRLAEVITSIQDATLKTKLSKITFAPNQIIVMDYPHDEHRTTLLNAFNNLTSQPINSIEITTAQREALQLQLALRKLKQEYYAQTLTELTALKRHLVKTIEPSIQNISATITQQCLLDARPYFNDVLITSKLIPKHRVIIEKFAQQQ
ncbi:MAG: hypothetical protein Tsb005_11390 [Gammaproteobacteria bacterium]